MTGSSAGIQGKTALVTGAAKRLGRHAALALAQRGAHVVVHYRESQAEAEATAAELAALGVKAHTVCADLADPDGASKLVPRAQDAAGPIDILVNNASCFGPSALTDLALADLVHNVQINAMAPLQLARAFAAQQRPGSIVNLLDTRMLDYDRQHAAYHLSKRMLADLTRMMALEFAPRLRVNAIAPGLVLPVPGQDDAFLERMAATNPLQAVGEPQDVARAMVYLLESPFVTGEILFVDGGYHMEGRVYG